MSEPGRHHEGAAGHPARQPPAACRGVGAGGRVVSTDREAGHMTLEQWIIEERLGGDATLRRSHHWALDEQVVHRSTLAVERVVERKTTGDGWWLAHGAGGLCDLVIDAGSWVALRDLVAFAEVGE